MRPCSASCEARASSCVDRHLLQQHDRIVVALAPQHRVELAEQADRLVVPRPPQVLRQRREPLMHRRDEVADGARLADDRRQLRAGRRQHPHVVVAERARLGRLHDEHALQHAAIDDRHAEERAIRILSRLAEVLEARMLRGVAARTTGRICSATSPASPSVMRICTRPTLSGRRPMVAASTSVVRSGSSR